MAIAIREPIITEPTLTWTQLLEERLHAKEEVEKADVGELIKVDNSFWNWVERTAKKRSISVAAVELLVIDALGATQSNDEIEKSARRETRV